MDLDNTNGSELNQGNNASDAFSELRGPTSVPPYGSVFQTDSSFDETIADASLRHSLSQEARLTHWMERSKDILDELSIISRAWGRSFQAHGIDDFSWCLGGAMKCGHFMGPKPTRNPDMEDAPVVEVDYRLMLPDHVDPVAEDIKQLVADVTGLTWKKDYDERRWREDKASPQSIFYGYIPMEANEGKPVEIELSVQRNSQWVEISQYWDEVFSPEEIKWQAFCRDFLRQEGYSYVEAVRPLKKWQCDDARWRILAGYASGRFSEQVPKMIEDLVQDWWQKDAPSIDTITVLPLSDALKIAPPSPKWVQEARAEAEILRQQHSV